MLTPIALLVPTRGRPRAVIELLASWRATTTGESSLVFAVDDDDPMAVVPQALAATVPNVLCMTGPRRTMGRWTNDLAALALQAPLSPTVFGSLGDDHRLEGEWEAQVLAALDELPGRVGIVYGDDTHHGENLATSAFVTANIVATLGWMIPPGIEHLYADNAWLELGRAAGVLRYLPEMRIPHNHPAHEGLTFDQWDQTYREGTGDEAWERDGRAFDRWRAEQLEHDAAEVRALVAVLQRARGE